MKFSYLLLCAAVSQIGISSLHGQYISNDVEGEVTEFSQYGPTDQKTNLPTSIENCDQANSDSEESLKLNNLGDVSKISSDVASTTPLVLSESTTQLPGPDANIEPVEQQYVPSGPNQSEAVNSFELSETAKANAPVLTKKQIRAEKRLAIINEKAAIEQAKLDAAKVSAVVPKNIVQSSSKIRIYGQLGIQDHNVGGLNQMLASDFFPSVGAYAYQTELGIIRQLGDVNSFDIGINYGLFNGLENAQRFDRPSTGQITNLKSTMWLIGLQTGVDHNLLSDSEWTIAVGLGVGINAGGLHLTERVEEMVTTSQTDPSVPTPEVQSVIHYDIVNISVTPRLTLRSPELANGWQLQARVGYQFGENSLLRVDEFTSIRNNLRYNPTGITASLGFVAPLPKLFSR